MNLRRTFFPEVAENKNVLPKISRSRKGFKSSINPLFNQGMKSYSKYSKSLKKHKPNIFELSKKKKSSSRRKFTKISSVDTTNILDLRYGTKEFLKEGKRLERNQRLYGVRDTIDYKEDRQLHPKLVKNLDLDNFEKNVKKHQKSKKRKKRRKFKSMNHMRKSHDDHNASQRLKVESLHQNYKLRSEKQIQRFRNNRRQQANAASWDPQRRMVNSTLKSITESLLSRRKMKNRRSNKMNNFIRKKGLFSKKNDMKTNPFLDLMMMNDSKNTFQSLLQIEGAREKVKKMISEKKTSHAVKKNSGNNFKSLFDFEDDVVTDEVINNSSFMFKRKGRRRINL